MICIRDLGVQFGKRWIFKEINLEIQPGESIVFIGPSGSGKSILLKTIAKLIQPTQGSVEVRSKSIGMLFQKNALFDSLSVEENLLFPLREIKKMTGEQAKKRAAEFLAQVGLKGCESLYPDEISGGMQKRLGIARALIVEPEVILYDEPTAGLDPITSKTIAELVRRLQFEAKTTLITVTNDMQRAYQIGDRIYLLAQEKLTLGGTPQQVQQTSHAGLRQFIYGLKLGPLTSELA